MQLRSLQQRQPKLMALPRPHKGDQIITQTPEWTRYTFAVQPGKRSMRSGKPGTGLYTTQATMIAKWTGQ